MGSEMCIRDSTSPAGTEVWDKQLKENYAKAEAALKGLGLIE